MGIIWDDLPLTLKWSGEVGFTVYLAMGVLLLHYLMPGAQ